MVSVDGGQVTQRFGVSGDNRGFVRRTISKSWRRAYGCWSEKCAREYITSSVSPLMLSIFLQLNTPPKFLVAETMPLLHHQAVSQNPSPMVKKQRGRALRGRTCKNEVENRNGACVMGCGDGLPAKAGNERRGN